MKIRVDVILVEGTNKQEFINSFDPETQADWWNELTEIPNLISMDVEESYLEEFKTDPRIVTVEERLEPFPANLPPFFQTTKTVTAAVPATSNNGTDYMPLQMYLDTDIISSTQTIGADNEDDSTTLANATYFSRWTGENVDIVSLEVGPISSSLAGVHDSHPDFDDPDNPGTSRIIPMDWADLESTDNNQITSNSCLSSHGMAVLSAAGGTNCGFAKKANLRAAYTSAEDGVVECINAIISWHNSKQNNPTTGVPNPTIMIAEYQYVANRYTAISVDSITSIVDLNGTTSRPAGGWGTDLTPFVSRNIMPFKVEDPNTNTWNWCIVFPFQGSFSSLYTALESAWDAGITNINAAGNDSGVYVKTSDSRRLGVRCTTSGTVNTYDVRSGTNTTVTSNTSTTTTWYPFLMYGPAGLDKGIDVAAGQNSETHQILDPYTVRGPGIDIVGLGANTWTAYPTSTYADGNKWGMFSGTSCATPTVVGKAACLMEKYFVYNNSWPSNNTVKELLINNARSVVKGVNSTTWSDVPNASTNYSVGEIAGTSSFVNHIENGFWSPNGGFRFTELLGTTTKRAFLDAQSFSRNQTQGKRPTSGGVYPRPKIRRTFNYPSNAVFVADSGSGSGSGDLAISITSSSFTNGGAIGGAYYLDSQCHPNGVNTSPQLSWTVSGDTTGADSIRILCLDPDASNFIHWMVFDIPVESGSISENGSWPSGSNVQLNDWDGVATSRDNGWGGPCPDATHTYTITFYIVDSSGTSLAQSNQLTFDAG